MLIAKSQNHTLVLASRQLKKSDTYACPSCAGAVYLKMGTVTRPHFAHYQREACAVFSEGETEEHIQGKLQLREWLERQNLKVEMEAYLPELKQRPDLLVSMGERKIALEFQCSGIAIEKVVERTKGYTDAGYEVVWILGEKFKYKRKLTAFQKVCLTGIKNELVLFHYSVEKKRLEYRMDFQLSQNQKMTCRKKSLRKDQLFSLDIQKHTSKRQRINYEIEHQKMLRQFGSGNLREFQQVLYEKGETLVSMPKELYARCPHEWMLQNHPLEWKMQLIWWLEAYPIKTILTKRKLIEWSQTLEYHAIPQITEEQKLQPLLEFMEILTKAEVLKRIRLDKWSIQNYPKRYQQLEEKLKNIFM